MWRTIEYHIWPREPKFEAGLSALVDFAEKRGLKTGSGQVIFDNLFNIAIDEFERVKCDKLEEFVEMLSRNQVFKGFTCNPFFRVTNGEGFLRAGVSFDHRRVTVDVASQNVDLVEATHRFLKDTFQLRNPEVPRSPDDRPKHLHPTVFVGRHFDAVGHHYYAKLSSFLKLLGFDIKQGEEYTSQAIPEKVKARIDSQDVFLSVVSGDRDHGWLIAESAYAQGKGKHVLLMLEKEASYAPTILGKDLEQLRFDSGHIEQTFISLLEEFRSIRVRGL